MEEEGAGRAILLVSTFLSVRVTMETGDGAPAGEHSPENFDGVGTSVIFL